MRLYREGTLFSHKRHIPTFEEYAADWWDWDTCEYLKNQKGRKDITKLQHNTTDGKRGLEQGAVRDRA
jgi:hypothetical protein